MHNFPLPQEFNHVIHVWVVAEPQNVVIGDPGFLLSRQILHQIRHGISFDCHTGSIPGTARSGSGVDTNGMVNKIGSETGVFDLAVVQISRQLMHNGSNHFQMTQFFCTNVRQQAFQFIKGHGVSLRQISQGRSQLSVRPAVLGNDDCRKSGIGIGNFYGILQFFIINKHDQASLFPQYSQGHGSSSQL